MPSSAEFIERARSLDWEGLQRLWQGILQGETPGWPPGKALEHLVLRAFELDGAEITWPFETKIAGEKVEQIDGVVYFGGITCLLECKDTAEAVSVEPIAKLRNQLMRRPAGVLGSVISKSGFSRSARLISKYLAPQAILLWEGNEIGMALEKQSIIRAFRKKYHYYIEQGEPDFFTIELEEKP
jgi:hypothetical protein